MKVKLIIDSVGYSNKPQGYEVGKITNRMNIDKMKEYSIEEIKGNILDGKTIRPSYCGGKEESWQSQQVFMIDIDENLTIEQAINKCNEMDIIPNFIYTSFSHTEEHHKFRLVFVLDKEITDYNTAKKIQLFLMEMMGESDPACKNLNRFYYAGKDIVFDSGNVLDADRIIGLSKDIEVKEKMNNVSILTSPLESDGGRKGSLDIKVIYNIPLVSSDPKTPSKATNEIEEKKYTIKAITNRDVEYLKDKYGSGDKKVFETNQEFIDYIRTEIDLGDLLEFNYPKSIRCIFHDDNNNSASIFQNNEGAWFYKCHSDKCGVSYNIVGIIERLAKFKSRPETYKFIREIFNLEIMETEWQKEQKDILLENIKILNDGEFAENCEQANKNINKSKHYLKELLLIAMDNVYNDNLTDEEGNVVFFSSASYICKQMGMNPNSIKLIYQKIALFSYHKMLNKLNDSEIPKHLLKKSMEVYDVKGQDKFNHVNFFSIPSYTVNKFPEIEQRGKQWKENHYTMKGVSREMFFRAEGLEIANELYPQYKKVTENIEGTYQVVDRTTTKASDIRTNNIVKVIHELIEEYGYATESAIVESLRLKYAYITTQVQIKKSLKEILDLYNLKRIRTNKEIKNQFRIAGEGYPFIIIRA